MGRRKLRVKLSNMAPVAIQKTHSLALRSSSNIAGAKRGLGAALLPPRARKHEGVRLQTRSEATVTTSGLTSEEIKESTATPITVEEQRKVAKQLVKYLDDKNYASKYEKTRAFGWVYEAELANSRWVMFGILVGLMTEFATGVNFPSQVAITITNLGFADLYE